MLKYYPVDLNNEGQVCQTFNVWLRLRWKKNESIIMLGGWTDSLLPHHGFKQWQKPVSPTRNDTGKLFKCSHVTQHCFTVHLF